MNISRLKPVVVVLGATGTGKSKLALRIASKFKGEVISADSMQVYKGMDILTNKVTPAKRDLVPHHMLDFLDSSELYSVLDFRNAAMPIITELHEQGKLPVIVGGTHFYVESLLWTVLLNNINEVVSSEEDSYKVLQNAFDAMNSEGECNSSVSDLSHAQNQDQIGHVIEGVNLSQSSEGDMNKSHVNYSDSNRKSDVNYSDGSSKSDVNNGDKSNKSANYSAGSDKSDVNYSDGSAHAEIKSDVTFGTERLKYISWMDSKPMMDLARLLDRVDPKMASILHPNDRRKIIRSLQVWAQTGVCHSEHLRRQRDEAGGVSLGGTIRFSNAAIFWITCDQEVLDARLDARVDSMIKEGLLKEISEFHTSHNAPMLSKLKEQFGERIGVDPYRKGTPLHAHYTKGILQSIGFKEFHRYLTLSEEERLSKKGQKLYAKGITDMEMRTKRYCRQQLRWIKNRFLRRDRQKIPLYTVDATDPSKWEEATKVTDEVLSSILEGRVPATVPYALAEINEDRVKPDFSRHFCAICDKVLIGKLQWKSHLTSIGHRLTVKQTRYSEARGKAEERRNQSRKKLKWPSGS